MESYNFPRFKEIQHFSRGGGQTFPSGAVGMGVQLLIETYQIWGLQV